MRVGRKINEGKTKIVYEDPDIKGTVFLYFKDSITAGDGAKKDEINEKGLIHWRTNKNIFELLTFKEGVPTHYIRSPEEGYAEVLRLDKKYDLEIVGRRVATGSYLVRHPDAREGDCFNPIVAEFFYKDDELNDPKLDDSHIAVLKNKNPVFSESEKLLKKTFCILEDAFAKQKHQLIDIKIEVGEIGGKIVVTDEITADSLRLWPYAVENPDFSKKNVLDQLDKSGMKDKQLFREGKSKEIIKRGFEQIAEMTDSFKYIR
ncbi:MAG: hypothetical protein KKB25_03270 [Nanoarchaeota archaeon]|nr:hypothetical protein [Nanoarchaeota archaeon]